MFIDNLKAVCLKKGTSPTALLKSLGMSTSSVTSWKKGVAPSVGTVYRIAEVLGVSPTILLEGWSTARLDDYNAGYVDRMEKDWQEEDADKENAPALTRRNERDIAHDLEGIMETLENEKSLMFDGDPMTDAARDSIMAAMKLGLQAAKMKNKERFTPKKYRKE
ncbi:MAG: helix-turn-helix transcriptional regulator [Pseudoflavonifractor sp.]